MPTDNDTNAPDEANAPNGANAPDDTTDDATAPDDTHTAGGARADSPGNFTLARRIVLTILGVAIAVGAVLVFATPTGRAILADPHQLGKNVHAFADNHAILSPVLLIGLYGLMTVLAMPVWWLQVLAGYGFGLFMGTTWCLGAAVGAAVAVLKISHWIGADWFQSHVESKIARLQKIDQAMGHNGFLVVLCLRLIHVLPFGLSNYVIGLTRVTATEIAAGTLLGNIPAIAFYVTLGVDPSLIQRPIFWLALIAMQIVLLIPVAIRYWRPDYFRRIGLE